MTTRADLLTSIATTIQDYREGEITKPTSVHVDKWVSQFDASVQLPLLTELNHVLKKTYFSKAAVTSFFTGLIEQKNIAGDNPCQFWKNTNILNIQQHGESQREIVKLFNAALLSKCNTTIAKCQNPNGPFIYLDDAIFSGGRVGADLTAWVKNVAPTQAKVHIIVIGAHHLGEWQCMEGLKKTAAVAGKNISFTCWAEIRLENRKTYRSTAEVLWPSVLPNNVALSAYMALESKFPFELRTVGGVLKNGIFSGEAGRQLLEQEMLLAGVKIRAGCQTPSKMMRPLGFSAFGLGFGSTIVTYRNCPNNCPLALWWGDPTATSGAMHWYPLLPRKTHAQSDASVIFGL